MDNLSQTASTAPTNNHFDQWEEFSRNKLVGQRNQLVQDNLPLVRQIAESVYRKIPFSGIDVNDLFQEGTLSLIDSVERFDKDRGVPFASYAYPKIRGAIYDYLRNMDVVPRTTRTLEKKISDLESRYQVVEGRPPTDLELLQSLNISQKKLQNHRQILASHSEVSMDSNSAERKNYYSVALDQASFRNRHIIDPAVIVAEREAIEFLFSHLVDRERETIFLMYVEGFTTKEAAERIDCSTSMIQNYKDSAKGKMRTKFYRAGYEPSEIGVDRELGKRAVRSRDNGQNDKEAA